MIATRFLSRAADAWSAASRHTARQAAARATRAIALVEAVATSSRVKSKGGVVAAAGALPGCDVQEGGRRRRARVRQRGVRQGARAAAAAVLQVQERGLLLQGVPGGRPGLPPPRTARRTRGRPLLPAHPHPHHFPLPVPPAARLPLGRPGTSTSAARWGRGARRRSWGTQLRGGVLRTQGPRARRWG